MPHANLPHLRFEAHVRQEGKCWIWTGHVHDGKGYLTVGSRTDGSRAKVAAHVFAYRFYNGPIAPGQVVYRSCKTDLCVNPNHLRVGSRSDLVKRAVRLGRWTQGDASTFPETGGERNGRSKLKDVERRAIVFSKGKVKAIILARRHNVTEQTIYATQRKFKVEGYNDGGS